MRRYAWLPFVLFSAGCFIWWVIGGNRFVLTCAVGSGSMAAIIACVRLGWPDR